MSKLGIAPSSLTEEGRDLLQSGQRMFDEVVVINPHNMWVAFENNTARVFSGQDDVSDLDVLIVRRTQNMGAAISVLVRALEFNGCNVVDPISRYSVGFASKLKTSIRRWRDGCGPDSYFAFSATAARDMITHMRQNGSYPAIIKPINGRGSDGKIIVNTAKATRPISTQFFADRDGDDMPLFMQKFEDITHEYRVVVVNGTVIAAVLKNKTSNRSTGSEFTRLPDRAVDIVGQRTSAVCNPEGIFGIDVGFTSDRRIIIIEENRAPEWRRLQEVSGVNIADAILTNIGQ